jgi:hypothetical protein
MTTCMFMHATLSLNEPLVWQKFVLCHIHERFFELERVCYWDSRVLISLPTEMKTCIRACMMPQQCVNYRRLMDVMYNKNSLDDDDDICVCV